jgi:hypothetical protein
MHLMLKMLPIGKPFITRFRIKILEQNSVTNLINKLE